MRELSGMYTYQSQWLCLRSSSTAIMHASGSSFKRRKIVSERSSPSSMFQQNVQIKQEAPDSPPLPQRRVVTSGSKRYLIPTDCEKGQPNFKHHRQVWSQKEADELRRRGFKPVRMFIRCVSEMPVQLPRLK